MRRTSNGANVPATGMMPSKCHATTTNATKPLQRGSMAGPRNTLAHGDRTIPYSRCQYSKDKATSQENEAVQPSEHPESHSTRTLEGPDNDIIAFLLKNS